MKIGVLFCVYKSDKVHEVLSPWIDKECIISACHGMFKEYFELGYKDEDKSTLESLKGLKNDGLIDYLYIQNDYPNINDPEYKYAQEFEIRNRALQNLLLDKSLDYVILLDSDEFYTKEEIGKIFSFINQNAENPVFYINFKNYIEDGSKWVDGFCPVRIFKVKYEDVILSSVFWDNDLNYKTAHGSIVSFKDLPSMEIPLEIVHIKHLSWTNDKSADKIKYQERHFNSECSYKFENGKMILNDTYFQQTNKPKPIIHED